MSRGAEWDSLWWSLGESEFSLSSIPPLLSCSLKGYFLQRSKTGCFSLISLTKQGLNLREGRQRDHSQVIRADIHQHSDCCWLTQPPSTARFKGVEAGTRPGERRRRPCSQKSSPFALLSPAGSVQFTLNLRHQD